MTYTQVQALIANFVAGHVREVVGVEYVPDAIEDAKINSAINNINNTKFYAGDMKDVLSARSLLRSMVNPTLL